MFSSNSSASTNSTNMFQNTSASTSLPFAEFWASVGTITIEDYFAWIIPEIEHETIELPAHEKSVHGRVKGRLKEPKPQCPRGFKHLRLRNEFSGPHFK